MALCRFSDDSDVYVYYDVRGGICCCRCSLKDGAILMMQSEEETILRLREHMAAGHKVPADVLTELAEADAK
jgi:hypothetical protein